MVQQLRLPDATAGSASSIPGQGIKIPRAVCVCACTLTRFSRALLFVTPWTVPPGSSAQGIVPARTLGWVAIPFSRGSSRPRDQTCVSGGSCIADRFFIPSHQGRRRCAGQPEENEGRQEAGSHLKLREGPVPGSPWRAGCRLLSVSVKFSLCACL